MEDIKAGLVELLRGCVERGRVDGFIGAKELATLVDVWQELGGGTDAGPREIRFVLDEEVKDWAN